MPKANRYIVPGNIYHLTQRCHDCTFRFRLARDRNGYRARLREAVLETGLSLLTSNSTSHHVHWVIWSLRRSSRCVKEFSCRTSRRPIQRDRKTWMPGSNGKGLFLASWRPFVVRLLFWLLIDKLPDLLAQNQVAYDPKYFE